MSYLCKMILFKTMVKFDYSKISSEDINSGKYVFKDVFAVYDYIKSKGWNIGWYAAPQFEIMELDKNNIVASPLPMQPLYRGQNAFFEKCVPSLYRRNWTNLQTLERLVQIEDFKHILQDNPEIQDNIKGGLSINYNGLAQHYGIETNIIDLTNSFGVAAFLRQQTITNWMVHIDQSWKLLGKELFIFSQWEFWDLVQLVKIRFGLLEWRPWSDLVNNEVLGLT